MTNVIIRLLTEPCILEDSTRFEWRHILPREVCELLSRRANSALHFDAHVNNNTSQSRIRSLLRSTALNNDPTFDGGLPLWNETFGEKNSP